MNRILIVDDDKNVLSSFEKIWTQVGYEILTANNAERGLDIAKSSSIDLLIMDIRMPGMSGLEAFSKFKAIDPKMPVIIMTAYGTTETAIEAMKLGAYDYVIKPFDVPKMKELIVKTLKAGRLMKTEVIYEAKSVNEGDRIVGASSKMQEIYKIIGQVAGSDVIVLLRGESGTGKELVARAIYQHSKRKDKPFLVINSAAIPETLLESELFGYERGAFTDARERRIGKFEQCHEGTIFLDEIGDMPHSIQTKILRILENKSFERLGGGKTINVNVRIIAATNKNMEALIKEGKFREDLYYRFNAVTLNLPALRERKEDIPQLLEYFIVRYSKEFNKNIKGIASETLRKAQNYNWPGNVRELENAVKKAVLFSKGDILTFETIPLGDDVVHGRPDAKGKLQDLFVGIVKEGLEDKSDSLYTDVVEQIEKSLIIETLKQTQGNQSQAAKLLGISRPTLKDKIEKFNLRKEINIQE